MLLYRSYLAYTQKIMMGAGATSGILSNFYLCYAARVTLLKEGTTMKSAKKRDSGGAALE